MKRLFKIDPKDNVAVVFEGAAAGEKLNLDDGQSVTARNPIPIGHKIALADVEENEAVVKYGAPIGHAVKPIRRGEHVHVHNLKTNLRDTIEYRYTPKRPKAEQREVSKLPELNAYKRANGKVGIRNELWVIPTVGCVNSIAACIVKAFKESHPTQNIDGVYSWSHPYGCSQLGDDHERTKHLLQNMAVHPNCGGVLLLGLGCENNQIDVFRSTMPDSYDPERVRFLVAQEYEDEIQEGVRLLDELAEKASNDRRVPIEWADLVVGLECGGSDGFSGITANPLIGRVSDFIVGQGGSSVLTEVPEMFGAEQILMERTIDEDAFAKTVDLVNGFKQYYKENGQPIYENPSPGNKDGGISTLEEKSLGCTQKAGNSSVVDVVPMEGTITKKGLNLLASPGNDIVATTTLGTAGCQLVLFSTGRGTPLGGFIPTVKIASNSELAGRKKRWIDFDAGSIANAGAVHDTILTELLSLLARVVNGEPTKAETLGARELALFKSGITL